MRCNDQLYIKQGQGQTFHRSEVIDKKGKETNRQKNNQTNGKTEKNMDGQTIELQTQQGQTFHRRVVIGK